MGQALVKRLLLVFPILFGMSVIVFSVIRLVPGDPVLAVLGLNATPDLVIRTRHDLGLDMPVYVDNDVNVLGVLQTYRPDFPELDLAVIGVFDDGVGSALILGGLVYRGGRGMAGEIGHLQTSGNRRHSSSAMTSPSTRSPRNSSRS